MSEIRGEEPPFTEAKPIDCLFVTGLAVQVSKHMVRVVGWVHMPDLGGETEERRIVIRFATPTDVCERLYADLDAVLGKKT